MAVPHLETNQSHETEGAFTVESFRRLAAAAHSLVDRQYALYNDELMPTFEKHGIKIVSHGDRNLAQKHWVKQYFEREVRPLLIPVALPCSTLHFFGNLAVTRP